jgi:hypothetical protein
MSVELKPKERKDLEDQGKILEKVKEFYYIKCEKKRIKISYIVHDADYISPQAQEVKDLLIKLSDNRTCISTENIDMKSIKYLKSLGYTITYCRSIKNGSPTKIEYRIYNMGESKDDNSLEKVL